MAKKRGKPRQSAPIGMIILLAALAAFSLFTVGTTVLPAVTCDQIADGSHFIWLPKSVTEFFKGDRINLHFILPQGKTIDVYGIVKGDGIENVQCGQPYGHDYSISMTWMEALALTGSEKPITDFMRFRQEGRIIVSPSSVAKMEKLLAAEKALPSSDSEAVPAWVQALYDKYRAEPSE